MKGAVPERIVPGLRHRSPRKHWKGKRELAPPIFRDQSAAFFQAILPINHMPCKTGPKKPERFHSGFFKYFPLRGNAINGRKPGFL